MPDEIIRRHDLVTEPPRRVVLPCMPVLPRRAIDALRAAVEGYGGGAEGLADVLCVEALERRFWNRLSRSRRLH